MSVSKLAGRYAKSLLDLAIEKGDLETVAKDMKQFKETLENRDFFLLLKSPIVNTSKKAEIFKRVFSGSFCDISNAFIGIVTRKRRESYLPEIVDAFMEQYKDHKQIATAKLTTAVAVNDELVDQVRAKVLAATGRSSVELTTEIDPSLIGGFILEFDNKLYDSSIAHKLEKLGKKFAENKYVRKY